MNRKLSIRILSKTMAWRDDEANEEIRWLTFISSYKYDSYQDYHAGIRFLENLIIWLQQFDLADRKEAYKFVKENLIFFSAKEIHRLVDKFFPEIAKEELVQQASTKLGISNYNIWSTTQYVDSYNLELRKTLFMGLSDGARLDTLRRANAGIISNEQVVISTQVDGHKWRSLLKDLQEEKFPEGVEKNSTERKFSRVFLIDDFTGSGTSLVRKLGDKIDGKLVKFANSIGSAKEFLNGGSPFEKEFYIVVHHYIGTQQAKNHIEKIYGENKEEFERMGLSEVKFTFGMLLPQSVVIDSAGKNPFVKLCTKYYDNAVEAKGKHGAQSGVSSKMFGYANCGLPIVVEHNTPNNSLPLIWAETKGSNGKHAMRPLFRRRERHSDLDNGSSDLEDLR